MAEAFDISDVVRRTGLTARALRFYDARGLVKPARSASGRRCYGPAELERLHEIVALKSAGLSLAQIQRLTERRHLDVAGLIEAQLEAVEAKAAELAEVKALLLTAKSRIDRGEPVNVATFCSLIRNRDAGMEGENWKKLIDRYFTREEKAVWEEKMAEVPAGFDTEEYGRKWKELSARIESAMPLDPASNQAQRFVDEWFALVKPFSEVATPAIWNRTYRMYEDMENWPADFDPGFSKQVWDFITTATKSRLQSGGTIDGPAWMNGGQESQRESGT